MKERLARIVFAAAALVVAASLAATLAWVLITNAARPLDGVEGDVLFEAARIRDRFPLYVDPHVGALEYGPPPSRYLVLYPPLWPALLSLVGANHAVARILSALSWFGGIAWIVRETAPARRRHVGAMAAFVAGIWVLALYGAMARPDAFAVLFVVLAMLRATKRGAIDLLCGVLFALAAWIKPNVVGALPGAIVGCYLATRAVKSVLPGILGGVLASALIAGTLQVVSHGEWLRHLLLSTGQPPNLGLWLTQMSERGPFFLLPFAGTIVLGYRSRKDAGACIATGALATSVAWCLLTLAKIGSASNYFLEPCVVMLVALGRCDLPVFEGMKRLVVAGLCLAQALWTGVATLSGVTKQIPLAFARRDTLTQIRATCDGIVLAEEPGLELIIDRRVIETAYQSTHLSRAGRFPEAEWVSDIRAPNVSCLVLQDDLLERPLTDVRIPSDRFGGQVRAALREEFILDKKQAGYWLYRRRR